MNGESKSDSSKTVIERLKSENNDVTTESAGDKYAFCEGNGEKINVLRIQDPGISEEDDETLDDAISKKKWLYNPLLPMRVTIFLWFGAGRVPVSFLSIYMKQKGLSLVEFSSVFSVTFVFQFLCATVCGIISDKIGNSKPILMFLMFSTMITIICMVFAPTVSSKSCISDNRCTSIYRGTDRNNLSYFNLTCFEKNTKNFHLSEMIFEPDRNSTTENTQVASFCAVSNHGDDIFNQSNCFSIFLSDMLENETSLNCSTLCLNYLNNTGTTCSESENKYIVIIYSILIILFFSFWSTTYRFVDIIVMDLVTKCGSYYGKERFVQSLGELSVSVLITFVLSKDYSGDRNYYDAVYCVSVSVIFLAFLSAVFIRGHINPPGRSMTKNGLRLIKDVDIVIFLIVVFVIGNNFAFYMNFNLWFLEKLNAAKHLLGLHGIFFCIYGLPLLLTSQWWLKKFGPQKLFILSLISYSFNGFSYSLIYNPWISLGLEWTNSFSYDLLWTSVVIHCNNIAPQGLVATVTAISGAVHYGIGRSTSIFGGGLLLNALGPRTTYRIFATVSLVTAVLYFIYLYVRKKLSVKACDSDDAEREEMKV